MLVMMITSKRRQQATTALLRAENECLEHELDHFRDKVNELEQYVHQLETSLRLVHVCACGRVCTMEEAVNAACPHAIKQAIPTNRTMINRTMSYPEALKAARVRRAQHKAQMLKGKAAQ